MVLFVLVLQLCSLTVDREARGRFPPVSWCGFLVQTQLVVYIPKQIIAGLGVIYVGVFPCRACTIQIELNSLGSVKVWFKDGYTCTYTDLKQLRSVFMVPAQVYFLMCSDSRYSAVLRLW